MFACARFQITSKDVGSGSNANHYEQANSFPDANDKVTELRL
jgi:hypothetical protein